jgi:hypothetical protein
MAIAIKDKQELNKETLSRVRFYTFIITEFARAYKMNRQQTYLYLKQYGGLDFLYENWWALHTDNPILAVHDINGICQLNGGTQ